MKFIPSDCARSGLVGSRSQFAGGSAAALGHTARRAAVSLALLAVAWGAAAHGNSPEQLRQYIAQQAGGLQNLIVPPDDASIPLPRQADGTVNPRYLEPRRAQ